MKYYKLALWKAYFDEGYGFTNYVKYLIAFVGVGAAIQDVSLWYIATVGVVYGLSCFVMGWWIYWSGFKEAAVEVGNRVNPFVGEMREKFK